MALYIKGDRILTEDEKNREDIGEGCGAMVILILGVLFILSPGIIITSLLNLIIDFTTGQLWGSAIVGSIIVAIFLACIWGSENISKTYLGTAVISTVFMIVVYLFSPNNCFYNTVKAMFDTEASSDSDNNNAEKTDSAAITTDNNERERPIVEEDDDPYDITDSVTIDNSFSESVETESDDMIGIDDNESEDGNIEEVDSTALVAE